MFNHLPTLQIQPSNPSVRLREQQAQDLQQRRLREDLKVALEALHLGSMGKGDTVHIQNSGLKPEMTIGIKPQWNVQFIIL